MTHHPAITVSRTLGSGGALIAYRVAQRLGWRYCDRSILRQTAEALALDYSDLNLQEEKPPDFLDSIFRLLPAASPEAPYTPPADFPLYGTEIFALECRLMKQILKESPAVIVGRGGFIALRDRPDTIHIHIHAHIEFRIRRLVDTGRADSERDGREQIRLSDEKRRAFIKAISGCDWTDARNFDLVLDPGDIGFDSCVSAIIIAACKQNLTPLT